MEKNWSFYDFIHTKKNNRLSNEIIFKKIYIYANSTFVEENGIYNIIFELIKNDELNE